MSLAVKDEIFLKPDPKRVLLQFFYPGNEMRAVKVIKRILNLSETETERIYDNVIAKFSSRHRSIESIFLRHFHRIENLVPPGASLSNAKKLLTGSYFSKEYSVESAALFNPSMVPHPDQSGLKKGELRFIMSLRATGEGHISSIEFRSGIIDQGSRVHFDQVTNFISMADKREEVHVSNPELKDANYDIWFSGKQAISERVIFPYSRSEQNGIEDARFVRFINDDKSITYYGTFTAYDGHKILSQLLQTNDFMHFKIRTLSGESIKDKGMAIFPVKINRKYAVIPRLDGENLYLMYSDDILNWQKAVLLKEPLFDWEFVQTGNCGSPVETERGWVLLTHGVGPVRTYVISAVLLDKQNPSKIIGYLKEPLLSPGENEREGYVPNVVYSCGGLIHNDSFIIPYATSDSASGIAYVKTEKLLENFVPVNERL